MLYSCADWLTTDAALLQQSVTQYEDDDAKDVTRHHVQRQQQSSPPFRHKQQQQRDDRRPMRVPMAAPKKQYQLFDAPLSPSSPSAVDDMARSPRSFEELQRGSLSLASSIEEFNAIIDADMSGDYCCQDTPANEPTARFFAGSYSANASASVSSDIKYGWTPFDDGEFQFASVERDDSGRFLGGRW